MKKKTKNILETIFLIALYLFLMNIFEYQPSTSTSGDYRFTVTSYGVTYDIEADRSMQVCENLEIKYEGTDSTGFIRDIPVNAGDRVKNVKVAEMVNGVETEVPYSVYIEDADFVSVDIGDYSNKTNETHEYLITYDYFITKPVDKNAIYLNAIGYGWESEIYGVNIIVNLPEGFIADDTKYYFNKDTEYEYYVSENKVTARAEYLAAFTGVTFDFYFEDGALSVYKDFTPYYILIAGVILLAVLAVVKLTAFNEKPLTPVVNFTPPNGMDPLIMGKYIDGKVNSEDVTSLIYYWANKGYLKINLDDENDPKLIRIAVELPEDAPEYQKTVYENLFDYDDVVKISSLTNKFYKTFESVKENINQDVKGLYTKKSTNLSILFAVLGGLAVAAVPIISSLVYFGGKLKVWQSLAIFIAVFIIYKLSSDAYKNRLKHSKKQLVLSCLGIAAAIAVIAVIYAFIIPTTVVETLATVTACIIGLTEAALSATLIKRTNEYTEILNGITGFKNFIELAEKDKLEAMLEENPQLYFDILPYAQVLGVTDLWADKFEGITVEPPSWMTSNRGLFTTYCEVKIISRTLKRTSSIISTRMISRPSSSGASGGGVGSFGGFGGGGHGGGGGRGR